ncbi:MAG: MBL fold metallo-hydrolase [Rhodospirillales bacterium]|jgi:7,8-dihydropterin-6-yl-methyl-4-(beta-D-ribofuranosyl)aminobenzene 5'-phosphate synthase|nr:MBL fold metallo-hydrolase [Rhodospirillaceae bacterium]MDP6430620.1 MBL fold metallo-hydrolase [Rhodospirillales bacterium]MDP6645024.1 MBL fold metallo-hydrolase [Rhodospirillales bacterium]MDP6843596.1 MBL fold metallo-hydrolase [Rhodospirillales bacterium]|tara:strand:+ start:894 stop:1895 length:1002 start_codon:yes stop_codon:yes gene_type:complete
MDSTQAPFTVPVVEKLSVRVVVDSFYERFLPKAEHPMAAIEHVGRVPGRQMTTFAAEWGLSLHLASVKDGAKAEFLLDFGYTPEILNRNFDLLDIDPAKLDGLILSHGHRDHFGGLDGFICQHRTRMRDDINLYVGGETVFREKWIGEKGKEPVPWGAIDRSSLVAQNVSQVCCDEPLDLDSAFTSGYIERQSFEKVSGGTLIEDDDDHFTEAERAGKLVLDQHPDEHATCYMVKGRGLVVISSCGHTGIVNTVKAAMAVANTDKLHAVIGGFHLGLAPNDYIENTLDELENMDPDVVVPMHCTGANFIGKMRERMPGKLVASNVGSRFTFGV